MGFVARGRGGVSPQGGLTLSQDVGLNVSVVVLTRPHEGSGGLEDLGHHVVDEPVLVPDLQLVKLRLVVPLENADRIA